MDYYVYVLFMIFSKSDDSVTKLEISFISSSISFCLWTCLLSVLFGRSSVSARSSQVAVWIMSLWALLLWTFAPFLLTMFAFIAGTRKTRGDAEEVENSWNDETASFSASSAIFFRAVSCSYDSNLRLLLIQMFNMCLAYLN